MPEDLNKTIRALAHKVHVLEEENVQLTEKAEDSTLLRLVSENIQNLSNKVEVFENTLERISILKAIPYATCGELSHSRLKPIASYSSFSDQKNVGYPIAIKPDVIRELEDGLIIINTTNVLECHFGKSTFTPTTVALIPFKTQTIECGVFVFMDDAAEGDRLSPMLMLLSQVADMAVAKYENMFLLKALTSANKDLESRVEQRTRDLAQANKTLEQEIAERKASELALMESHQTLLTVLNSIDATIYVADLDTYEILFMNKCMIDEFGQDLTGQLCFEVFRGEYNPCDFCTSDKLLNDDGSPKGVVVWQGKNPVTGKWYVNYDRAINWIDGRLVRLQIATDITQIKAMESQLQQAQKMEAIGTLAGGIAHDFNNLLMGIQGRASLMLMNLDPSHPHVEHVSAIEECIRSATDLTKQLLGFARGGKYEVKPTDINELVLNSATMFGRTQKEIRIHTKWHNPPPVVAVDRRQIEQVLLNLFVNAWQAMPDGGELFLETRVVALDEAFCEPYQAKPGRYTKVTVTDTGIGMDESIRRLIFDPFFTTKEKGRGTGLGLASAYGIINNHNGIITVHSEVGQGTTFNIYLPVSDKAVYRDLPAETGIVTGLETVILVDDEEMILNVGKPMLEKLGYRVVVAKGGAQAVDAIKMKGDDIDLVILDLIMPGMDGGKTFELIRELQPAMPVILSSGFALNDQANDLMQRGCNGFIQKPFNISKLSRKVRKILDDAKGSTQG